MKVLRSTKTPNVRLTELVRAAILKANGNLETAYEGVHHSLLAANDAALERELCAEYRRVAIRAVLAVQYNELRAEGQIAIPAPLPEPPIFGIRERPRSWAGDQREKITKEAKRGYLHTYLIDGVPLGECTVETVLSRADRLERDAQWLRHIAQGIPPGGKIGDFLTEQEVAEQRIKSQDIIDHKNEVMTLLLKKVIKTDDQYRKMLEQAKSLEKEVEGTWGCVKFKAMVSQLKWYEDDHLHLIEQQDC